MQETPKSDKQLNLQVLSELHEIQEIEIENEKPVPVMQGTVTEDTQWAKCRRVEECSYHAYSGGFHTQSNISKVIGKYMESSGMCHILVESEVFGETTAENILKCDV